MTGGIEPFRIAIPEADVADLRERLGRTRWLREIGDNADWRAGANLAYMRELAAYWQDGFDWRKQEQAMNAWPHFRTCIDGFPIHFIHVKGKGVKGGRARENGSGPMPLILNHGWPWSFWDFAKVIGPLSDPAAHGGDPADAFDVVVPSLPGYAFSTPLRRTPMTASNHRGGGDPVGGPFGAEFVGGLVGLGGGAEEAEDGAAGAGHAREHAAVDPFDAVDEVADQRQ